MKRVVLLHGKDKSSSDIWYPWIKSELAKDGVGCNIPDLPSSGTPNINEWLAVIESLAPDDSTILVGHSRGGMAILRYLESMDVTVAKVVLVAANSANIEDGSKDGFYSGPYDFDAIRKHCNKFVVMHSKDDPWVPYEAGLENAKGLGATLVSFENKAHFGKQPDNSILTTFPELLEEIMA